MALEEKIKLLRAGALEKGNSPVPEAFQSVTKERIQTVLKFIDRLTPDLVDVVFALLDDEHDSWFTSAPLGAKFESGASTAHLACHVGILQRGGRKLDREGRDYWIKPLRELGAIECVFLDSKTKKFVPGHPIPKSSNSAYRLAQSFKQILKAKESSRPKMLDEWIQENNVRQRAKLQAELAEASLKLVDTKHSDLISSCCDHYAKHFLADFKIIYIDEGDGDRISDEEKALLEEAGLEFGLGDAIPDVLLWNCETDALWIIEAVTSDGEVDVHKFKQLKSLAERSGKTDIGFTTAYRTWKDAAMRQHQHKNIAPHTYIWIEEDPSKHFLVESF